MSDDEEKQKIYICVKRLILFDSIYRFGCNNLLEKHLLNHNTKRKL